MKAHRIVGGFFEEARQEDAYVNGSTAIKIGLNRDRVSGLELEFR
jgi:hypothetical protein